MIYTQHMENELEIVLASKQGSRDWVQIRVPANWRVRHVRLSRLMEQQRPAAITVIKSDPGADTPHLQALANSLGKKGLTKSGNDFLVWIIDSAPPGWQFYRDLLRPFAQPSHVEIVRLEGRVESWLRPFIAKVELITERQHKAALIPVRANTIIPPRPSPLDNVRTILAATKDLRTPAGKLSAEKIARTFGVTPSRLAQWLGRSRQALLQAPDSDSLQLQLGYFERIARLRTVLEELADFRKWIRMPNDLLGNRQPLELIAEGKWQEIADLVDDMLVGAPG